MGTISYGVTVGWMGIAFTLYDSDDCPLASGRVQLDQLGWIASMLGIGGLVGTILAGWMAERIGRKYALLSMAVPQIVSENSTAYQSKNKIPYSHNWVTRRVFCFTKEEKCVMSLSFI